MKTMTRMQVAERSGVNGETVRYYERRGLIPAPPRSDSGYRQYSDEYVERIRFIKRAQELGFSLREIEELLQLRVDPDSDSGDVKRRAEARIVDVEGKIRDLERVRVALKDLLSCCSGSGSTRDCPILEAMSG